MQLYRSDIEQIPRVERLKLINGLSGIKQANLIGTSSKDGILNVAIFNSITHLGSSPALLAFILRPQDEGPKGTYQNILETGCFTINHVHESFIEKAHYTSAKLEAELSEFERCGLTPSFIPNFEAPFVAESHVKIGLKHEESIPIHINGTLLVIGKVEHIWLADNALDENGYLDIQNTNSVGVVGLNSYYGLHKKVDYPYVRLNEIPEFVK